MIKHTALLLLVMLATGVATSQPNDRPEGIDRGQMKERLEAQLESSLERVRMIRERLDALERGEVPAEFQFENPSDRRERRPEPVDTPQLLEIVQDTFGNADAHPNLGHFRRILAEDGPERDRLLERLRPRLQKLRALKESNPASYALHREEMAAGMQIAHSARALGALFAEPETDPADLEQAQQSLLAAITQGFDAKAAITKNEIQLISTKLEHLTTELEQAELERQSRIDAHYDEMIRRIKNFAGRPIGRTGRDGSQRRQRRPSGDD